MISQSWNIYEQAKPVWHTCFVICGRCSPCQAHNTLAW